jgi:hypothetical protein
MEGVVANRVESVSTDLLNDASSRGQLPAVFRWHALQQRLDRWIGGVGRQAVDCFDQVRGHKTYAVGEVLGVVLSGRMPSLSARSKSLRAIDIDTTKRARTSSAGNSSAIDA